MEIDKPTDLEYVEDDFEEGEHEKLDEEIREIFPFARTPKQSDRVLLHVLTEIITQSEGRLLEKCYDECEDIIQSKPGLRNLLLRGSEHGYKSVRLLKLLRKSEDEVKRAIQSVWEEEYVGEGANLLWAHIRECFNMRFNEKYSAIIQSSGMGKSRAVDEMSKSHFVIPVNLREHTSNGYPPTDGPAHIYLTGSTTQRDALLRSCSFLHGLFVQTADVLKDIKEPTAEKFWKHMNEGMDCDGHGPHRKKFYCAVETFALRCHSMYSKWFHSWSPPESILDDRFNSAFPLRKPFEELCKALEDESVPELPAQEPPNKRRRSSPESQASEHPLVVLAFDEAHTLTEPRDKGSWSCLGEMRRAIRGLSFGSPLFTLFLSSSGAMFRGTPPVGQVMPFCELGFDTFANRLDFNKTVKLSQVTSEEHLTSYGRPLFALRYRHVNTDTCFRFAAMKLLGGIPYGVQALTDAQKLGCLAHRIPIEFISAMHASQVSDLEMEQVYHHLRVVLKVDHSLETMVTMSPSEPVLSEAAYFVMTTQPRQFNPPEALQAILNGFEVDRGEVGELIVALLFTMARDEAVGPADDFGRPPDDQRWCSLTELLTSLFCTPSAASSDHVSVVTSKGWHFTADGLDQTESSLADAFTDSKVYFTHFVKVHQQALIHVEYLMRLMARGAAVLCASGQLAVDGIIPFLLKGDEIRADNIGVIMFQVTNDEKYSNSPQLHLFHAMDPYSLGILGSLSNVPIIRIVFALGAKTPSLACVDYTAKKGRPSLSHVGPTTKGGYTTYDFWVSGLSPKVLVPVGDDPSAWDGLLQTSYAWERMYSDRLNLCTTHRRFMNPGTGINSEFWENWCDLSL